MENRETGSVCYKCGSINKENARFCYKCGTKMLEYTDDKQISNNHIPTKKSKKNKLIIAIVAALILIAGATTFIIIHAKKSENYVNQIVDCIKNEDYSDAQLIISEYVKKDSKYMSELIVEIKNYLEDSKNAYYVEEITYKQVKYRINGVSSCGLDELSNYIYDLNDYVYKLNQSREAFEAAETRMENCDYVKAIAYYSKVISDDTYYETAQSRKKEAIAIYKDIMLDSANWEASNKNYEMAIATLIECENVIGNDPDISALVNTYSVQAEEERNKETVKLTVWCNEQEEPLFKELVNRFKNTYTECNFDIDIGVKYDSFMADEAIIDPYTAADVFMFYDDQLDKLSDARVLAHIEEMDSVLQKYTGRSITDIKNANGAGAVEAACINGEIMAFPKCTNNGYFLMYDSSVLSEEDVASWDNLLKSAGAAGKKVAFDIINGWYSASFFFGAGFETKLNTDGSTFVDFDGISEAGISGIQVVQSMINITENKSFMPVEEQNFVERLESGELCAFVSGTWNVAFAKNVFGDGFASAKLPTFTCNGKQIQQGSFAGYQLVGVNAYSGNVKWATLLADFLTNEEAQAMCFAEQQIVPTNIDVIESDAVTEDAMVVGLVTQGIYGHEQNVGSKFWNPMSELGNMIVQGAIAADDEKSIQRILDNLVNKIREKD